MQTGRAEPPGVGRGTWHSFASSQSSHRSACLTLRCHPRCLPVWLRNLHSQRTRRQDSTADFSLLLQRKEGRKWIHSHVRWKPVPPALVDRAGQAQPSGWGPCVHAGEAEAWNRCQGTLSPESLHGPATREAVPQGQEGPESSGPPVASRAEPLAWATLPTSAKHGANSPSWGAEGQTRKELGTQRPRATSLCATCLGVGHERPRTDPWQPAGTQAHGQALLPARPQQSSTALTQ